MEQKAAVLFLVFFYRSAESGRLESSTECRSRSGTKPSLNACAPLVPVPLLFSVFYTPDSVCSKAVKGTSTLLLFGGRLNFVYKVSRVNLVRKFVELGIFVFDADLESDLFQQFERFGTFTFG
jgi:hypothetical protein